jgi:hypothetical protein
MAAVVQMAEPRRDGSVDIDGARPVPLAELGEDAANVRLDHGFAQHRALLDFQVGHALVREVGASTAMRKVWLRSAIEAFNVLWLRRVGGPRVPKLRGNAGREPHRCVR